MSVRVQSGVLRGVDAEPVEVEVDLLRRLPGVCVVGLAASSVREAAERVRSAIAASAVDFPRKRVVVNLAPADVRKEGTSFDLPMAVGILAADGAIPAERLGTALLVGELSLGGALRPVRGAVALALLARSRSCALVLPEKSAAQAALVPDVEVYGARDLAAVIAHLRGERALPLAEPVRQPRTTGGVDLAYVRGQQLARRALEIAAAGGHHLPLWGPPGCGKLGREVPSRAGGACHSGGERNYRGGTMHVRAARGRVGASGASARGTAVVAGAGLRARLMAHRAAASARQARASAASPILRRCMVALRRRIMRERCRNLGASLAGRVATTQSLVPWPMPITRHQSSKAPGPPCPSAEAHRRVSAPE